MGNFAENLNLGKRVLPPSPPPPCDYAHHRNMNLGLFFEDKKVVKKYPFVFNHINNLRNSVIQSEEIIFISRE